MIMRDADFSSGHGQYGDRDQPAAAPCAGQVGEHQCHHQPDHQITRAIEGRRLWSKDDRLERPPIGMEIERRYIGKQPIAQKQ